MVTALVILADGFESVEAIAPIDILRRAGVELTLAGLDSSEIVSAQGVKVKTDVILNSEIPLFDLLFLPGGMPGSLNLAESEVVIQTVTRYNDAGKIVAAICAAPAKVLAPNGFLDGKNATCYPANMQELTQAAKEVTFLEDKVVIDDNIVTSRGVGTSLELGYSLVELLISKDLADELRSKMLVD